MKSKLNTVKSEEQKFEKAVKVGTYFGGVNFEAYKHDKLLLGSSDIAQLTMLGFKKEVGAVPVPLKFGGDGSYSAWLVDDREEIPAHYNKIEEFSVWVKLYDDTALVAELAGATISIYRAGDYGCLICIEA